MPSTDTPVTTGSKAVHRPKKLFADENADPGLTANDPYDIDADDDDVCGEVERVPLLQQARNLMLGSGRGR